MIVASIVASRVALGFNVIVESMMTLDKLSRCEQVN